MSNKQIISNLICLILITGTFACVDASNSVNVNINLPSADEFPPAAPHEVDLNDHRLAILIPDGYQRGPNETEPCFQTPPDHELRTAVG